MAHQGFVRRIAILGNVNVGKTSLFDKLTASGDHSINIPGSTLSTRRGLLAEGPGAAPRRFRRHCGSCNQFGSRLRRRRGLPGPCCMSPDGDARCPAMGSEGGRGSSILRDHQLGRPGEEENPADAIPLVVHLIDTPGSATMAATSEDEMVARDLLLSGMIDSILLVADAKNLRRSLALTLEAAEFGLPMVLDLNMIDEAESMGIDVDSTALSSILGVPVIRTIAVERVGVHRLSHALVEMNTPRRLVRFPEGVEEGLDQLASLLEDLPVPARPLGILLLSDDAGVREWLSRRLDQLQLDQISEVVSTVRRRFNTALDVVIADAFHAEAERITRRVVVSTVTSPGLLVHFGSLSQRPFPGLLIAMLVLVVAYFWIGAFGATFVVDALSTHLFNGFLIPVCEKMVAPIPSAFIRDAIMDPDFGLLPAGLFLAVGIVLPVLFCFYLLQAILEDSGYLPRLSVLLDRMFRWMGLNGQGLIPLVLGFSCVTMAVITTRMLPSRKERLLLTFLLILGIPCAPLLAVMLVILGTMPWTAGAVVFGVIVSQTLLAGFVAHKLIPGRLPDLILEIPRMRLPRSRILLVKTWRRTWQFMEEAVPIFLIASFVVFLFDRIGGLAVLEDLSRPLVNGLLGLPDEAVQVFIKTAIRRENGATELNNLRERFDNLQLLVTMVVMVFLLPCFNSVIVAVKERGLKAAMAILSTVVVYALVIGAAVNWICRSLGVTFMG